MALTKVTDHAEQAKEKLLQQFKGLPNFASVLDSYSTQIQLIEDMLFEQIELRFLDDAEGVLLDGLGQIVGVERGGLDDDAYRLRIRAQIKINLSSGTIEDINEIMTLVLPGSVTFALEEDFPGAIFVDVTGALPGEDGTMISGILQKAKAGGVRAIFMWYVDEDTFQFTVSGSVETDADKGFGDDTITTVGGLFANADDDGRV